MGTKTVSTAALALILTAAMASPASADPAFGGAALDKDTSALRVEIPAEVRAYFVADRKLPHGMLTRVTMPPAASSWKTRTFSTVAVQTTMWRSWSLG